MSAAAGQARGRTRCGGCTGMATVRPDSPVEVEVAPKKRPNSLSSVTRCRLWLLAHPIAVDGVHVCDDSVDHESVNRCILSRFSFFAHSL